MHRARCLAFAATAAILLPAPAHAIVGGRSATPQDNPSMVGLAVRGEPLDEPGNPFCGGSLIAPTAVLTAAHCLEEFGSGTAYANRMDVIGGALFRDDPAMQRVPVTAVIRHPAYNRGTALHDMVVLRLGQAIFAPTIPLAGPGESAIEQPGALLWATGWGLRRSDSDDQPIGLKAADIPVVPAAGCRDLYGAVFSTRWQVCAGSPEGRPDTCQGDSGGPLFLPDPLTLVATVSYGPPSCAEPDAPGVYARVSAERDWVLQAAGLSAPAPAPSPEPPAARSTVRTRIGAIGCDEDTCRVTLRVSGAGRRDVADVILRVDRRAQRDLPPARRVVRARKRGPGIYRATTLLPLGDITVSATPYAADGTRLGRPATEELEITY